MAENLVPNQIIIQFLKILFNCFIPFNFTSKNLEKKSNRLLTTHLYELSNFEVKYDLSTSREILTNCELSLFKFSFKCAKSLYKG